MQLLGGHIGYGVFNDDVERHNENYEKEQGDKIGHFYLRLVRSRAVMKIIFQINTISGDISKSI